LLVGDDDYSDAKDDERYLERIPLLLLLVLLTLSMNVILYYYGGDNMAFAFIRLPSRPPTVIRLYVLTSSYLRSPLPF
jgi:hypothetical protein